MQRDREGTLAFSPSDLITFLKSPFASWMERCHVDFPGRATPDDPTGEDEILWKKGLEHERAYLESLKAQGRDVAVIPDTGDRLAATLEAMRAGREVIYQARLKKQPFAGFADFLERVPGKSRLGMYQYSVSDTKLSREPQPYFLVQLSAYAEMLEEYQGVRPDQVAVVLRDRSRRTFRTDDYFYYYKTLKRSFLEFMDSFDVSRPPAPDLGGEYGRWAGRAAELLDRSDHLSRVAGISKLHIKRLEAAGITTLEALAQSTAPRVPKIADTTLAKLREQAAFQLAARSKPLPPYRVLPPPPEDPRKGLALLPPPSSKDVFFDMEGYPHFDQGLEYLFGAVFLEGGDSQFVDWWAHDPAEEKKAFEDFIDWVCARWHADPAMHIYHYAAYEVSAMRRLMGRHATREDQVDELLRNEVFVDLYAIVRNGLRAGTASYSIKDLEVFYRAKRSGDVKDAGGSIVQYQKWLDSGEPRDWNSSPLLTAIRDYNRDDCDSTWRLADWLRARQREAGIAWVPKSAAPKDDREQGEDKGPPPQRILADSLRASVPREARDRAADAECWRVHELISHLVEFHRREAKPVWWAMFERHAMTEEELVEDLACLGGLERESAEPVPIKRSKGFWYRYKPDQDTKLDQGSACFFAHDLGVKTDIEQMEREEGRVLLKFGPTALAKLVGGTPPARLSLIPDEYVSAKVIADAVFDCATRWKDTGKISPAIEDFLFRRSPRIRGHVGGALAREGEDVTNAALRIVPLLEGSTLCIQGPPGAGKTYTAAKVILSLLALGKRVGITANSHKAILNLMRSCAKEASGKLACVKVKGDDLDPFFLECQGARFAGSIKDVTMADRLVGGTAWDFSAEASRDGYDYLFVDEAGQVSVANLLGMSRSARNLVLVGDQMQLGQPIQGSHPGESGQSVLDYYLQGKATIPEDKGLFLGTTWRLHPKICDFISGAVYEGRLQPQPHTAKQVIRLPDGGGGTIPVDAGILFVAVDHEGNTQGSDEEATVIREIARELLTREYVDRNGVSKGLLTIEDLLFVAPYNLQVRKLKTALGLQARKIGSVDRFQGQEAPAVIVSMCASDAETSPRGIEFLMNRNRLNVAISRAQSLAIVVASPSLAKTRCSTVDQMALVNTFCRILEEGIRSPVPAAGAVSPTREQG